MPLAAMIDWGAAANNIISGSIGGTLLEVANATINIWTMIRMVKYPSEVRPELSYR